MDCLVSLSVCCLEMEKSRCVSFTRTLRANSLEFAGCSFPAERHEEKPRILLKKSSGMTRHGIELRFTNWKADAFAPLQAICRPNKATVTLRYFACGKNAQQRFPQRSCSTCGLKYAASLILCNFAAGMNTLAQRRSVNTFCCLEGQQAIT